MKERILKDICNWFEYELLFASNGKIVCLSNDSIDYDYVYDNIDCALTDWLTTLLEENGVEEDCYGNIKYWDEEIKFIENLQK